MNAGTQYRQSNRGWLCRIGVFFLSLATGVAAESSELPPACTGLVSGPTRTVARVIDGETVALDDGTELRLIGALVPRAMDAGAEPGMWPLEIAAGEELRALVLGKSIELAYGGERLDRHGRLQAQAFWMEGDQRRWVQGHLLGQGLARAYVQAGNRACGQELLEAERLARQVRRGLWADAAYQVRSASSPLALSRYRSTFQVVEGRIARVAQARGTIYLNFGKDREAFAVSLRRGDRALLPGSLAGDALGLEGKRVRVRGWIEGRRGPTINLSSAGLIKALDEPETPPPGLVETGR